MHHPQGYDIQLKIYIYTLRPPRKWQNARASLPLRERVQTCLPLQPRHRDTAGRIDRLTPNRPVRTRREFRLTRVFCVPQPSDVELSLEVKVDLVPQRQVAKQTPTLQVTLYPNQG